MFSNGICLPTACVRCFCFACQTALISTRKFPYFNPSNYLPHSTSGEWASGCVELSCRLELNQNIYKGQALFDYKLDFPYMMNIKFCQKKLTVKLFEIFISLPIFLLIKSKLYIQRKTEILTKPGAREEITIPAGKSTLWEMLEHPHITETTALKEQIYACHRSALKYIIKNSDVLCTFES